MTKPPKTKLPPCDHVRSERADVWGWFAELFNPKGT